MAVGITESVIEEIKARVDLAELISSYGIQVVSIFSNSVEYVVPDGEMRIYPGDLLGVIGTDEQILRVLPIVEASDLTATPQDVSNVKFMHFTLKADAPIVGKSLGNARLREDYSALLVSVERKGRHLSPALNLVFQPADILWIVGNEASLTALHE